ncbi:MAG: queuosine precursor transporter [Candidatus Babeliales bacterium]
MLLANETLFILQALCIGLAVLIAVRFKKEGLIAYIALAGVLANLFVSKQIDLFGLTVTASDTYMIGASLSLNALQEFYGRTATRLAIWIAFFCQILFVIMSLIHCAYIPSPADSSQAHYCAILHNLGRIVAASLFAYNAAEWTNYAIFILLKKALADRWFTFRSFIATASAQLLDTVLFGFLGLHGLVASLTDIIFMSLAIKLGIMIVTLPCMMLIKKIKQ